MFNQFSTQLKAVAAALVNEVLNLVLEWTKPLKVTLVGGTAHDVVKTKTATTERPRSGTACGVGQHHRK